MKLRILALNLGMAAALFSARTSAQVPNYNPPEQMTYQGFLADANGVGLAPSNPLNYDAIFRIYDSANGGTLMWAETQIITVDKGIFSVILGQGSQNGSEPRPPLSSVFASSTASDRFIAINVKIGANALDILPRLRLVPGAYSFLAKNANNIVDSRGTNVINTVAPGLVGINKTPSTALDVNGTVTATAFAGDGSALTGLTASQVPALDVSKLTSGTLDTARLSANVPLLNRNPQAFSGVNTFSGVGINTANPTGKLHVNGGVAVTGASSPYAVGTAGMFMEYSANASLYGYDYGAAGGPKNLILQGPGGNVGIGTTAPGHTLQVSGGIASRATGAGDGWVGMNIGSSTTQGFVEWYKPGPSRVAYMGFLAQGNVNNFGLQLENNANFMISGGNVGIGLGGANPTQMLDVSGNIFSRQSMFTDGFFYSKFSGVYYALVNGGQNTTAIWNTSDERLKKEVATIQNALSTLSRLRGVSYHWNEQGLAHLTRDIEKTWRSASGSDEDNKKLWTEKKREALDRLETAQTGFVAQEVEKIFPSWVRVDEKGYKQINVEQLAGVIVQAVNELREKSEAQESELKELRAELAKARAEKKTLAAVLSDLNAREEAREARLARIENALARKADARELSSVER